MSSDSDSDDEIINRVVQRVLARAARRQEEANKEAIPRPIHRRQSVDRATLRLTTGSTWITLPMTHSGARRFSVGVSECGESYSCASLTGCRRVTLTSNSVGTPPESLGCHLYRSARLQLGSWHTEVAPTCSTNIFTSPTQLVVIV